MSPKTYLTLLRILSRIPLAKRVHKLTTKRHAVIIPDMEWFGLRFRTPLGLGPGLDRNGDYCDIMASFGFSHICVGPISLEPQENDPDAPNKGIRHAISQIQKKGGKAILALAITPSRSCVGEEATVRDCLTAFSLGYDFADMFILDFRPSYICKLVDPSLVAAITDQALETRLSYDNTKPILIALPPGIQPAILDEIVAYCRMNRVDGIILQDLEAVKAVAQATSGRFPVIYAGGLKNASDAPEILDSGATMIHISGELPSKRAKFIRNIYKSIEQHNKG
jgi:dihydroorotate dehydrogenase